MKTNSSFFQKLALLFLFTFLLHKNISAQLPFVSPINVVGTITASFESPGVNSGYHGREVVVTTKISMYEIPYQYQDAKLIYTTEKGIEIIKTLRKYNNFDYSYHYFMLLSNGHIIDYSMNTHTVFREFTNNGLPAGTENFLDLQGDDLYVLSQGIYIYSSSIYKSSNNGQNFFIDTIGLNNATLRNMTLDTFQNVYLATSNGLFSQTLIGNNWIKNTHLPVAAANCSVVFADRRNRIFVYGGDNKLYKSLDLGSSFTIDTAGIGTKKVISIADDSVGNIYLVVNSHLGFRTGDRLYRSDGGTAPFVRIDMPITVLNADVLNPDIFNAIAGDSLLFTSTQYGLFKSNDYGNTWVASNQGIHAEHFYGLVRGNNGRMLSTTDLGCFEQSSVDTVWNKVYPSSTYAPGQGLFKDNNGVLYTQGATLFSDINSKTRMIVKSTDNGVTWLPDTLGIYQIYMSKWFVDENGVQHAAQYGNGAAPIKLFAKQPGQSWLPDNAGYTSSNTAQPIIFGSNGNGKIYFSQTYGNNLLWSKQGAAPWSLDTVGVGNVPVYSITSNSTHQTYLGTYNYGTGTVWKQNGNGWIALNNPGGQVNAFAITVDSYDRIWAALTYFDASGNAIGYEVVYSTNDGVNWLQPNFQIDTITFKQLVAIGDSVYGLSYFNGAYLFRVPSPPPVSNGIPPTIDSIAITYTPLSNITSPLSPPYYSNYPPASNTTATIYRGDRFELSLKVNNSGSPYNIAVWADYNNDNIFDPVENVLLTSRTVTVGSNWLQVPLTLSASAARIRIRVSSLTMTENDCCNTLANGETEDYTLTISQVANCRWIGRVSTNWHDANNWSCGIVPDATKSVMIPTGTPFNCEIISADVTINRIWIQPGATITVDNPRKLLMNGRNATLTW